MKRKESILLEIRAGEGGRDAKLLVKDTLNIYLKSAKNQSFESKLKEKREGFASIWIAGVGVKKFYQNESGTHRWLRVPPTEKYNRTQTSTITVAIIDPDNQFTYHLNRNDVVRQTTRSGGKGGQNVNKVETCVILTHIPTGTQVRVQDTRNQKENELIAWQRLEDRLKQVEEDKFKSQVYQSRYDQIGKSERSDKKRSYRVKEDMVIDHETGKSATFKEISRGRIELLN